MRNEERDSYVIPPNFIEGGTLLGGMFKTRKKNHRTDKQIARRRNGK